VAEVSRLCAVGGDVDGTSALPLCENEWAGGVDFNPRLSEGELSRWTSRFVWGSKFRPDRRRIIYMLLKLSPSLGVVLSVELT